jgi:hypothetical protein
MTMRQLILFGCLYLVMLIATAYFTRAAFRRIAGSLAGAAAVAIVALGVVAAGERAGWWHMAIRRDPWFLALFCADIVLCAYVLLITWRIARRFGGRGLALVALAGAILGPPRDYWYMRHFPEWGSYAPGLAPVFAISATYVVLLFVGQGVMRLVAGPAGDDPLARQRK